MNLPSTQSPNPNLPPPSSPTPTTAFPHILPTRLKWLLHNLQRSFSSTIPTHFRTVSHTDGLFVATAHVLAGYYSGTDAGVADEAFAAPVAAGVVDVLCYAHVHGDLIVRVLI